MADNTELEQGNVVVTNNPQPTPPVEPYAGVAQGPETAVLNSEENVLPEEKPPFVRQSESAYDSNEVLQKIANASRDRIVAYDLNQASDIPASGEKVFSVPPGELVYMPNSQPLSDADKKYFMSRLFGHDAGQEITPQRFDNLMSIVQKTMSDMTLSAEYSAEVAVTRSGIPMQNFQTHMIPLMLGQHLSTDMEKLIAENAEKAVPTISTFRLTNLDKTNEELERLRQDEIKKLTKESMEMMTRMANMFTIQDQNNRDRQLAESIYQSMAIGACRQSMKRINEKRDLSKLKEKGQQMTAAKNESMKLFSDNVKALTDPNNMLGCMFVLQTMNPFMFALFFGPSIFAGIMSALHYAREQHNLHVQSIVLDNLQNKALMMSVTEVTMGLGRQFQDMIASGQDPRAALPYILNQSAAVQQAFNDIVKTREQLLILFPEGKKLNKEEKMQLEELKLKLQMAVENFHKQLGGIQRNGMEISKVLAAQPNVELKEDKDGSLKMNISGRWENCLDENGKPKIKPNGEPEQRFVPQEPYARTEGLDKLLTQAAESTNTPKELIKRQVEDAVSQHNITDAFDMINKNFKTTDQLRDYATAYARVFQQDKEFSVALKALSQQANQYAYHLYDVRNESGEYIKKVGRKLDYIPETPPTRGYAMAVAKLSACAVGADQNAARIASKLIAKNATQIAFIFIKPEDKEDIRRLVLATKIDKDTQQFNPKQPATLTGEVGVKLLKSLNESLNEVLRNPSLEAQAQAHTMKLVMASLLREPEILKELAKDDPSAMIGLSAKAIGKDVLKIDLPQTIAMPSDPKLAMDIIMSVVAKEQAAEANESVKNKEHLVKAVESTMTDIGGKVEAALKTLEEKGYLLPEDKSKENDERQKASNRIHEAKNNVENLKNMLSDFDASRPEAAPNEIANNLAKTGASLELLTKAYEGMAARHDSITSGLQEKLEAIENRSIDIERLLRYMNENEAKLNTELSPLEKRGIEESDAATRKELDIIKKDLDKLGISIEGIETNEALAAKVRDKINELNKERPDYDETLGALRNASKELEDRQKTLGEIDIAKKVEEAGRADQAAANKDLQETSVAFSKDIIDNAKLPNLDEKGPEQLKVAPEQEEYLSRSMASRYQAEYIRPLSESYEINVPVKNILMDEPYFLNELQAKVMSRYIETDNENLSFGELQKAVMEQYPKAAQIIETEKLLPYGDPIPQLSEDQRKQIHELIRRSDAEDRLGHVLDNLVDHKTVSELLDLDQHGNPSPEGEQRKNALVETILTYPNVTDDDIKKQAESMVTEREVTMGQVVDTQLPSQDANQDTRAW